MKFLILRIHGIIVGLRLCRVLVRAFLFSTADCRSLFNLFDYFSFSRLLEFLPRVPHLLRTQGNCSLKLTLTNCLCIQGSLFVSEESKSYSFMDLCIIALLLSSYSIVSTCF